MHRALRMRGKQHRFIQGGFNLLAGHVEEHHVFFPLEYPAVSENFPVTEIMHEFKASGMQGWRSVAKLDEIGRASCRERV